MICLNAETVDDTYTLALMAYAHALYDPKSHRAAQLMTMLESRAIREGTSFQFPVLSVLTF